MNKTEYLEFIEREIEKTFREAEERGDKETMDAAKGLMATHMRLWASTESESFFDSYE